MTRVLYIGGYGRSGSTVLDTMLGNHERVFGSGELEMLFKDIVDRGRCTCGEPYDVCPLWGKVLSELDTSIAGFNPYELAPALARFESTLGRYSRVGRASETAAKFGEVWSGVITAAARLARADVVVDSSKSSRGSSRRALGLVRRARLDVAMIHLVRDPRAVLYSEWGRGNNDEIEARRRNERSILGVLQPLIGWSMANLAVSITAARLPSIPVLRVRYEDLVGDPEATLQRIGEFADIDFSSVKAVVRNGEALDVGHGVRGNRMRRGGPIRLRPDTEWISEMPRLGRYVSPLFWPVARLYGYRIQRWPTRSSERAAAGLER